MTRDKAREQLKSNLTNYVESITKKSKGKNMYVCPLCNSGTKHNQTGAFSIIGNSWKCFSCNAQGDIFDLYGAINSTSDYNKQLIELCQIYGITVDRTTESYQNTKLEKNEIVEITDKEKNDYTDYFKICRERLSNPEAIQYLSFRGISKETAERFNLGYDPTGYKPFLIIPTSTNSYVARNTTADKEFRYMKHGKTHLFNVKELKQENDQPIFIVEGEIDALSVIEAGSRAIGLGSIAMIHKFINQLKASQNETPFILSLDNDESGQKAEDELAIALKELNKPFIRAKISGQYKDPNEALTSDRNSFLMALERAKIKTKKPDSLIEYLDNIFINDIKKLEKYKNIKTGFKNIDEKIGSLYPGLYTIGAISSLGKTTFVHQIADQIAESGQDVLFFSLEQSRFELASKSIARHIAKSDIKTSLSALSIRKGNIDATVLRAYNEYKEAIQDRLSVIEGNFETNIDTIKSIVDNYIRRNCIKPVVILDYLQVIQNSPNKKVTTKEAIDIIVTELKRFSRDKDLVVIVISSLNRTNYLTPIDFESFKESGSIEYTSDVVWGLQLQVLNNEVFSKDGHIKEKRDLIRKAKAEKKRKIEFVCLKNRYGLSSFKVGFNYYPEVDLFVPDEIYDEEQVVEIR